MVASSGSACGRSTSTQAMNKCPCVARRRGPTVCVGIMPMSTMNSLDRTATPIMLHRARTVVHASVSMFGIRPGWVIHHTSSAGSNVPATRRSTEPPCVPKNSMNARWRLNSGETMTNTSGRWNSRSSRASSTLSIRHAMRHRLGHAGPAAMSWCWGVESRTAWPHSGQLSMWTWAVRS